MNQTTKKAIVCFLVLCLVLATYILVGHTESWRLDLIHASSLNTTQKEGIYNVHTDLSVEDFVTQTLFENRSATDVFKNRNLLTANKTTSRRHVIINSYMRSGSSFFGELLGLRSDTLYWFELFWSFTRWGFMKDDSMVCDSRTCQSCIEEEYASRRNVTEVLRDLFKCNFSNLTSVLDPLSVPHSGPLWKTGACNTHNFNAKRCLSSVQNRCRTKPHIVTKILRASGGLYDDFLKERDDVVVIQLFRDPRGVINSRTKTGWYGFNDSQTMSRDIQCLCSRMYADYKSGLALQAKYPGKFMFVIYEDLLSDLPKKLDRLYKRLGMKSLNELLVSDMNKDLRKLVSEYNRSEESQKTKDFGFWWRSRLKYETVHMVDTHCKDIYKTIGYKGFVNEKQFRDFGMSTVEVNDDLKL